MGLPFGETTLCGLFTTFDKTAVYALVLIMHLYSLGTYGRGENIGRSITKGP